jgi:ketosteroid isomerase-like protein
MSPKSRVKQFWLAVLLCVAGMAHGAPSDPIAEAQALHKGGKSVEALRQLDALIAQRPADANPRFQKGVILADLRRTGEAIVVFQRLVEDYPALPEPMNNLAVLYSEQGQMEKARSMLEAAIRSKPSYGTAFQNLGDLYTRLASRAYSRALQIDDTEGAPKLAVIRTLYEEPASVGNKAGLVPPSATKPPLVVALDAPKASAPSPGAPSAPSAASPPAVKPSTPPGAAIAASATASLPASPTTPASAPQQSVVDDARLVNAAVQNWATAWGRKDLNAYFAAYTPGYKGTSASAAAWQASRRDRISGKKAIRVELSGLTVEVAQGVAKVSFSQHYAADQLRVTSQKTLELVKQNDKWLIRKESVG